MLVRVYTARSTRPPSRPTAQTGKPVRVIKAGTVIADQIVLSESNNWFEEFGVSVGGVTYDDLIIEETGLRYPGSDVVYPVVSIDEAQEAYPGAGWINVGWTNPDNKRVATDNHVYEVAPGSVNQVRRTPGRSLTAAWAWWTSRSTRPGTTCWTPTPRVCVPTRPSP